MKMADRLAVYCNRHGDILQHIRRKIASIAALAIDSLRQASKTGTAMGPCIRVPIIGPLAGKIERTFAQREPAPSEGLLSP